MLPPLTDEKLQTTIHKNDATSYGLTLVAGLPLSPETSGQIRNVQKELEELLPGRFAWYGLGHLHATLAAPLRGRYRERPPLKRRELPADLPSFVRDLGDFFAQLQPFPLELAGVYITEDGFVMVSENTLTQQLTSTLRRYPELDQSKHLGGLHVSIGFLNTYQPFSSDEERRIFEESFAQLMDVPIGQTMVHQVSLVHYANRTLNRIVGKVLLDVGHPNALTAERLLKELDIEVKRTLKQIVV